MKARIPDSLQVHELAFARTFVAADQRVRFQSLLSSEKKRKKFLSKLRDFHGFDERCVLEVQNSDQNAARVLDILMTFGAPEMCYVTSENPKLDSRQMAISVALTAAIGMGFGTIISCLAGHLAFYEGEYNYRLILRSIDAKS